MAKREFYVCDICGKAIVDEKHYQLVIKTDEYYVPDPAGGHGGYRSNKVKIDMCPKCAKRVAELIREIATKIEEIKWIS